VLTNVLATGGVAPGKENFSQTFRLYRLFICSARNFW
jgi:hypothetical protein